MDAIALRHVRPTLTSTDGGDRSEVGLEYLCDLAELHRPAQFAHRSNVALCKAASAAVFTASVYGRVLGVTQHLEVFRPVVAFVAVPMMNLFALLKEATNHRFRNERCTFHVAAISTRAWMVWSKDIDVPAASGHYAAAPFGMPIQALMVVVNVLVPLPRLVKRVLNRLAATARAQWTRVQRQHVRTAVIPNVRPAILFHALTAAAGAKRSQIVGRIIYAPSAHALIYRVRNGRTTTKNAPEPGWTALDPDGVLWRK